MWLRVVFRPKSLGLYRPIIHVVTGTFFTILTFFLKSKKCNFLHFLPCLKCFLKLWVEPQTKTMNVTTWTPFHCPASSSLVAVCHDRCVKVAAERSSLHRHPRLRNWPCEVPAGQCSSNIAGTYGHDTVGLALLYLPDTQMLSKLQALHFSPS